MTRQQKSERERAQEALGISQRKVEKLRTAIAALEKQLRAAKAELKDAEAIHTYRAAHPALPDQPADAPAPPDHTEEETPQS